MTKNGLAKSIGGHPFGSRKTPVPGVDPKHIGALTEIMACEWLIRQGYEVFRNISPHGLADYVAWKPGEAPLLIDVKSSSTQARASAAQISAGVRILYVDKTRRMFSFNRKDCKPNHTVVEGNQG